MMSIEKGKYFSLEGPSGRIWELLESPAKLSEIHEKLVDEYDVAPDVCEKQLLALVTEMRDQELVVCTEHPDVEVGQ